MVAETSHWFAKHEFIYATKMLFLRPEESSVVAFMGLVTHPAKPMQQ